MTTPHQAHAQSLCRFIDASPSPFHVVESARQMLHDAGFGELESDGPVDSTPGRHMIAVDGSLMAWIAGEAPKDAPFRIVGAHTDSPNLRLKPMPDADAVGYRRLGVEVYGGVLLNSWLDRDLGLSGRVAVRTDGSEPDVRLVRIDEPILRIPQLAIHLDRDVNDKGLILNRQQHLAPIFGLSDEAEPIMSHVARAANVSLDDIVGADLMLHDVQAARLIGTASEFISAARLDNQLSCHAAVTALAGTTTSDAIPMVALFDHEEVGSVSFTGAATSTLPMLLERIVPEPHGAGRSSSLFISADNAHATHPNYPERHETNHHIAMNAGPVLKFNSSQRYTTDAKSAGVFRLAAERAGVATQSFVSRSDLACGSTIGPTVAASLGMRSLDVGCAQLSMHSARELAGSHDPWDLTLVLAELIAN